MVGSKATGIACDFEREHGMNGNLFQRAICWLLPTSCALCGAGSDDTLCPACIAQFFGADGPRCHLCANPLASESASLCGQCITSPPAFDRTLVAADYALPVDQLVLQLKFGHRLALAALMARRLAAVVRHDQTLWAARLLAASTVASTAPSPAASTTPLPTPLLSGLPALLCPVPLGPRRLAQRGYNQALEIARPLARELNIALHARLVARVRETAAQSSVAPERRRANIAGAFALADPALVRGRHIGVVDDVMTSGGTLDEMAAMLKRHGAARVTNLVFARTPPH
jgi:ComF family protein